jgi:hypothetical protein
MGPDRIVFIPEAVSYLLRFFNGWENIRIQHILPEGSVQSYDAAVLLRIPGLNLLPFYEIILQP